MLSIIFVNVWEFSGSPFSLLKVFALPASTETPTHVHWLSASTHVLILVPFVTTPISIPLCASLSMNTGVAGLSSDSPPPATHTALTPGVYVPELPHVGRKSAIPHNVFSAIILFLWSRMNLALHHSQLRSQIFAGSTVINTGAGTGRPLRMFFQRSICARSLKLL